MPKEKGVPERPTCLILTSKTGGGHVSLAESLADFLGTEYAIEIVDPQPELFLLHYRLASRYALWLWSAEFQWVDTPRKALLAHRLFSAMVHRPLAALIDRVRPDVIITTYAFFSFEVMRVLSERGLTTPLAMLYTDPNSLHAAWLTERGAAAVLAPTRETLDMALAAGVEREALHLVGWPVRAQFTRERAADRDALLGQLNLNPDRLTIFLQGGGEGAARFASTVDTVLAASPELQVILATGTNQALFERFSARPNLHALPFTRDIARYMAAADVVMGKAGPNTLFEAVALGKPFIATAYIPGQEEGNLDFIRQHGLGEVALSPEAQRDVLVRLVSDRDHLAAMCAGVEAYRSWNAAANASIVSLIRSLHAPNAAHTRGR
jgi:UDP-N-acetylglucosamine:LPS N-acetylglucosamine transferase